MSGKKEGGGPPSLGTIVGLAVRFIAVIALINWGWLGVSVRFAKDTSTIILPQAQAAVAELGQYSPAVGGFAITYGDKTWTVWGPKQAGTEWTALWGPSSTAAGAPGSPTVPSSTGVTTAVDVANQLPVSTEDPAVRGQKFMDLLRGLITVVGGNEFAPDFSHVEVSEVATARQIIATMISMQHDIVNPPKWSAQLEDVVQQQYIVCFVSQDMNCLQSWGPLQTKQVINPTGAKDWLKAVLNDPTTFNAIVTLSVNTNVQQLAQDVINEAWEQAHATRVQAAMTNLANGMPSANDLYWGLAGQNVGISVDEGWQTPKEIGGGRGKITWDDKITFSAGGKSYTVPAEVALQVVPNMTPETKNVVFPAAPPNWDPTVWSPGKPIP